MRQSAETLAFLHLLTDFMSRLLQFASAAALAITTTLVFTSTVPGFAQQAVPAVEPAPIALIAAAPAPLSNAPVAALVPAVVEPARGASLRETVAAMPQVDPEDEELRCLAAGIYFESKGESLEGQLAVAHVIINRAESGRFAGTYCGVLTQRGQFSFVRGGVVPQPRADAQWWTAVAVARVARAESWDNPAPGALFFHAARVSPGWNRPRVARIDNHVFYR